MMNHTVNEKIRFPAEFEPHSATWLAWPERVDLWQHLALVQKEWLAFANEILSQKKSPEILQILVNKSRPSLVDSDKKIIFHTYEVGDIWLRDTMPLFCLNQTNNTTELVRFQFNGWGQKYLFPGDVGLGDEVIAWTQPQFKANIVPWVLEGGSIEVDGTGLCLTTKECLLNPNRNPQLSSFDIEEILKQSLGIKKTLWLDKGLLNDHTDGHIDNIARFIAPGVVVFMEPCSMDDPNKNVYQEIKKQLESFTTIDGRRLELFAIPSAGLVRNFSGEIIPASHMNFYISNEKVLVPLYGSYQEDKVIYRFEELFPTRKVVGLPSYHILEEGGGSFHCMTQPEIQIRRTR